MKLNKKETAWLERFRKTMKAAPKSLSGKIGSYTIGDPSIELFDQVKFDKYISAKIEESYSYYKEKDKCFEVDDSGSRLESIDFPFHIESTSG